MQRNRRVRAARTLVLAVIALVMLGGCVDVVQYISGSGSTIDVYLRLTLQKSAFEMANSFSDEPQDLNEMFDEEFDLDRETVLGELPPGVEASFETVNDEFEYGFVLSYSAARDVLANAAGADDGAFVPQVGIRGMTIPLAQANEDGDDDAAPGQGDEFAGAFLGGSKYRVFISRRLVSRVSSATLVSGANETPVTVIELPDVWMVQFPVSLWLMSDDEATLEIVY
jgi:hypothetical protein